MMGTMNTTTRLHLRSTTPTDDDHADSVEQLTLLPTTSTPARFRLSNDTRERGLRHIAEIRQMLAARTGTVGTVELATDRNRAA
jgi:hypothetical protein